MVRPFKSDNSGQFSFDHDSDTEEDNVPEQRYTIAEIKDKKIVNRKVYYLVEWAGYQGEDTWEPRESFEGTTEMPFIDEFEARREEEMAESRLRLNREREELDQKRQRFQNAAMYLQSKRRNIEGLLIF